MLGGSLPYVQCLHDQLGFGVFTWRRAAAACPGAPFSAKVTQFFSDFASYFGFYQSLPHSSFSGMVTDLVTQQVRAQLAAKQASHYPMQFFILYVTKMGWRASVYGLPPYPFIHH